MRRGQGVPGLVVGLVVLILAIGIGVWLTSSDGGGAAGEDAALEHAEDAQKAEEEAAELEQERREEAAELREERREERQERAEEAAEGNG